MGGYHPGLAARSCRHRRIMLPNANHARHGAPPPHARRRRALRRARRDVRRTRSVPLPRRRAARSRRILAPPRPARRPLDPPRLRQLRLHRKDFRYHRRALRPLVPGGLARAGDRLRAPARVLGSRYASEAASACARYAYEVLRAPAVISLVAPDNVRSQRVAERGGARVERELVIRGRSLRVFLWPKP